MIRIDKLLCGLSGGTRSQIRELLKKGGVTVDGVAVTRPDTKIDEARAAVCINGKPYAYQKYRYYMLHKPAGVVTATQDQREQTVLDLLAGIVTKDLFPVGRLDKDTEGLLLITNDGALAHGLLSPRKHVDKSYLVVVKKALAADEIKQLEEGVDIGDDSKTLPAVVEIRNPDTRREIILTIREGRYHQIKRMMAAVGNEVIYLKRLKMGTLTLPDSLPPGGCLELTQEEISKLRQAAGMPPEAYGAKGADESL